MKMVPGSWLCSDDEVTALSQHLFATYLSALARRENRDWQATPLAVSTLTPGPYWRDLARSLLAKGTLDEQLRINDMQRAAAMHDPAHPLSLVWRPESEEHLQAVLARMREALPGTADSVLEEALVRACGFATKEALSAAFRPRRGVGGAENHDSIERAERTRQAAWESSFGLRPSQARYFDRWLNLEQIGVDGTVAGQTLVPSVELPASIRYRNSVPDGAELTGAPAFSEALPSTREEALSDFKLSTIARLRVENLPWAGWHERFSQLSATLVDATGRDEEEVETALRKAARQGTLPLSELVADFETLDLWQALTRTVGREFVLELEDRCETLAENHRLPRGVPGITDDAISRVAQARRWVMALVRPIREVRWLGPMTALQLLGCGKRLVEVLGSEIAEQAYRGFCCAGRLDEFQGRVLALQQTLSDDEWSERAPRDWQRMLEKTSSPLRTRLTKHEGRMFFDVRATREEWAQCFAALPPQWFNAFEAGPTAGELLDALPDEAVLEATIEQEHGFASFDAVAFPHEALPAVMSCASENFPQLTPARANRRSTPTIPAGWLQVEW